MRPDCKKYGLPGGHLEMCETFEHCGARELEEETTLKIEPKNIKTWQTFEHKTK